MMSADTRGSTADLHGLVPPAVTGVHAPLYHVATVATVVIGIRIVGVAAVVGIVAIVVVIVVGIEAVA
jgi:hypothetical protein